MKTEAKPGGSGKRESSADHRRAARRRVHSRSRHLRRPAARPEQPEAAQRRAGPMSFANTPYTRAVSGVTVPEPTRWQTLRKRHGLWGATWRRALEWAADLISQPL